MATVDYFTRAAAKLGTSARDSIRLYMIPGMQHCGDGPGADEFGAAPGPAAAGADPSGTMTAALERWVERGTTPSRIVAAKYNVPDQPSSGVKFTRPLCPYPQVARYKGTGSVSEASNFACATP